MFWTILRFELRYHLRRPSTYLFFLMLFLAAFFSIASDAVNLVGARGNVMKNAPFVLAESMTVLTAFGQVITTALVGTAILRDFQIKSHELVFTTRVTRMAYLGGRFCGAYLIMLLVYAAIPLGAAFGTLMPWVDPTELEAFRLASYVQPFLLILVPNVLFISALFFAVGALTRNLFAIYIQGIVLLVVWQISQQLLGDLDKVWLASLVDPFGLVTVLDATRYWTVAEKNSRLLTLTGVLLWNRVLWIAVAGAVVGICFALVRLEVEPRALWRRKRRTSGAPEPLPAPALATTLQLPRPTLHFDFRARASQLASQSRFFFSSIIRETGFLAIAAITVGNIGVNTWYADEWYDSPTWPVTGMVARVVQLTLALFLLILCTFYAGELVWRERQLRADGATDSLPVPPGLTFAGKFVGFVLAMAVLLGVVLVTAVGVQTVKGYHHYELGIYIAVLYGLILPTVVQLVLLAFVVHTLVNNKYVGHAIMVVYFLLQSVLNSWGFERVLYHYGRVPGYVFSDMNGFGLFAKPLIWETLYNTALAAVLAVIAYTLWLRGTDSDFRSRLRTARERWGAFGSRTQVAGGVTALAAVATGAVVFYNTAVLNPYVNSTDMRNRRAAYEKEYRRFRNFPQPRIVDVHARADLVPEHRSFALRSVVRAVNKHDRPVDTLYVSLTPLAFNLALNPDSGTAAQGYRLDSLVWSRPTTLLRGDTANGVFLYRLAEPLGPGDTITLAFGAHYAPSGFPNDHPNTDIVEDGTFLNSSYFPSMAYDEGPELATDATRREHGLAPKVRARSIDDTAAYANQAFIRDADWISFDAVVSTAPGQIAIAPGYLVSDSMESGRRVFHYRMDAPILNFYSFLSGRYAVRREEYKGTAIEIYYHAGHEFDLDRMVLATKRTLDYCQANFSPYQFRQYRIIEFPRYQLFAESFPNTIPFSEGIGFIARVRNINDLDEAFFVTSHELGHQWWAHQLVGADVQGSAMLSESFAEYTALVVLEHEYGAERAQKFLRHELDRYLAGRGAERKKELPLMLVEDQPYIHYNKGALVMYALQDYIGERAVDAALHQMLVAHAFKGPPYPTTRDFLAAVRAVTPDSLQYVIHDLFETITLYDNQATAASATRRADGTYDVTLTIRAKKFRADSLGNQTEIPIDDYVDVGAFGPVAPDNKLGVPLVVKKVKLTQPVTVVHLVTAQLPLKAGVDPYNKLIDRTPEDNLVGVEVSH
jgi:ABC-2 type transport system permease protein